MDLGWVFLADAIVGNCVAVAVISRGNCNVDLALSGRALGLRNDSGTNCAERVWPKPAQLAFGHARAHRYAAGIRGFFAWLIDLEKNPHRRGVELARPIVDLRPAHSGDVDQRTDCLRVFASRNRSVSIMATKKRGR